MSGSEQSSQAELPCQLCGEHDLERFVVPNRVTMWYCPQCRFYQYGEVAKNSAYAAAYHQGYEHHRAKKLKTAIVRLNRIASLAEFENPRLLDIGCSVGCTIEAAEKRGWQAFGVDVSDDAVVCCRERGLQAQVVDSVRLPFADESFEIVTSWHVIEHVADVTETLSEWQRVLRPGGLLVMETPDADCLKVRLQGAGYRRFWAPEHTYTFTSDSLAQFVERADLVLLPQPVFGRLTDLSLTMSAYTVMYQSYQTARRLTGISKAFQIFARRPLRLQVDEDDLPAAA